MEMTRMSAQRANIQTFERLEKKFLMSEQAYHRLMERIGEALVPDAFGVSDIRSVYLDTPSDHIVRFAMTKPVYKEKVRLRSYGKPDGEGARVFLELKKKFKGIVYKRRLALPVQECRAFVVSRTWPASICDPHDEQIMCEIAQTLARYDNQGGLHPRMFISSKRRSFVGAHDQSLRLTFDEEVLWRTDDLDIAADVGGQALLEPHQRLLEVKAPGGMPKWLADALCDCGAHATPFSKYGRSYLALCAMRTAVA